MGVNVYEYTAKYLKLTCISLISHVMLRFTVAMSVEELEVDTHLFIGVQHLTVFWLCVNVMQMTDDLMR